MNERRCLAIRVAIAVAFAATFGGCGSDLVSVHGSVQYDGGALSGARIVFTPIGGGKPAWGKIQADGTFQLTTDRTDDGAAPGRYRVRVVQTKDSDTGKLYTNYTAPRDKVWNIVRGQSDELAINIRAQDGWQVDQDN